MDSRQIACECLSELLTYPGEDYPALVQKAGNALDAEFPEAARSLETFIEATGEFSASEFQESFTRTFDLNPVCCLEIGWQLHGEEYARGTLMVAIRDRLRSFGIEESGELPDHLSHILLLLGRMDQAEASEFIDSRVSPALDKMIAGVDDKANPFEPLLRSIDALLRALSGDRKETVHG